MIAKGKIIPLQDIALKRFDFGPDIQYHSRNNQDTTHPDKLKCTNDLIKYVVLGALGLCGGSDFRNKQPSVNLLGQVINAQQIERGGPAVTC